jgi:phosphoribosylformimino-5-aminoimidazole carboxamide ribotide isomerase
MLEVGGGVRSEVDIDEFFDLGIDRLIVGTILIKNPDLVLSWIKKYGNRLIAGIDARDGKVKIQGWEDDSGVADTACALSAGKAGFKEIIYTNISKDGMFAGPDIARTNLIGETSGTSVIVSGGIGSYDDLESVRNTSNNHITGVIIGKAIYENKISVADAIKRFQTS